MFGTVGPYSLRVPIAGYGRGLFSCVSNYLAVESSHRGYVSMKTVDMTEKYAAAAAMERLLVEQEVLRCLQEAGVSGVVREYGIHRSVPDQQADDDGTATNAEGGPKSKPTYTGLALSNYVASDYDENSVHWGTLHDLLRSQEQGRLDEKAALLICRTLTSRLAAIHEAGVALVGLATHDIAYNFKTEELILTNFSQAKLLGGHEHILLSESDLNGMAVPLDVKYDEPYPACKIDSWSLGVLTHQMVCGSLSPMLSDMPAELYGALSLENGWIVPRQLDLHQDTQLYISILGWPRAADRASASEAVGMTEMCIKSLESPPEEPNEERDTDIDEDMTWFMQPGRARQPSPLDTQLQHMRRSGVRPVYLPTTLHLGHGTASDAAAVPVGEDDVFADALARLTEQ